MNREPHPTHNLGPKTQTLNNDRFATQRACTGCGATITVTNGGTHFDEGDVGTTLVTPCPVTDEGKELIRVALIKRALAQATIAEIQEELFLRQSGKVKRDIDERELARPTGEVSRG